MKYLKMAGEFLKVVLVIAFSVCLLAGIVIASGVVIKITWVLFKIGWRLIF